MKIANTRYEVTFDAKGGEMQSFTDKEIGVQYLYQGKEGSWSGKNPTLFPIVANTYDSTYVAKGKTYQFKNHGLIRYETLTCIANSDNQITFELKSNADTLAHFPYVFTYHITYTLDDNKLTVVYDITNDDDESMPFTFGLHPGFSTALLDGEKYEDYTLEFELEEDLEQLIFDGDKAIPHQFEKVHLKKIPLNFKLMEKYLTLIYRGMSSSYITLKGSKHGVKVSIAGYPYLAFWTPQKTDRFICIEPWYSHGDFEKIDVAFKDREGMMELPAHKSWTTSYTIEVF